MSLPPEVTAGPFTDASRLTAEELRILTEWSGMRREYPEGKCLHELVEAQVERAPEAVALICGGVQHTYAEFNARANQLAHYLRNRGIGPKQKVGICLQPRIEFAIAVLAVMKAGAACVPLDPHYPQERLSYMLQDVSAPVVLTHPGMLPANATASYEAVFLAQLLPELSSLPKTNPDSGVTPTDVAYVIYTSGSTGKPRGVLLSHAGLVNYNAATSKMFGLTADDRMLQFCSISFDIAIEELFATWMSGATLVLRTDETSLAVPDFLNWVEQQGVTILDLPTAYWHEWVHHFPELKRPVPSRVRLVMVGGEKASPKACITWSKVVGRRVRWINSYGPTEASISVTTYEPAFSSADAVPENIPIGRSLPNCQVYVLDENLRPAPVGVPGELYIGGVCVALGYHNRPELTAQKFIPDPFSSVNGARLYRTGDLARFLPSGDIEFLGREDDQVKIRGFRVELGEIEACLAKHPGLRESVVIAREDASGGKFLVAYLVSNPGPKPTVAGLRHYMQQHLPDYMVPAAFVFLDTMPLTPNGKINRRGLPEPPLHAVPDNSAPPADAFQLQLVRIWEEVLGRKPIGIRDNFFEIGGQSLLAARLMYRLGQDLGKTLPLAMLFESPTIEQLAAALRQDGWTHHWSSLVPIQPVGSKPAFFCVHGVGGNVVGFHELGRRLSPDFPLYGLQSQGLDGKHACHKTIADMARHYGNEIRSVQPKGPYFIGGFSLGGLIAYEIAQQLRAQGEEVALLALFDTYPGNVKGTAASFAKLLLTPSWQHWRHDLPRKVRKKIRRTLRNLRVPKHLLEVRDSNAAAAEKYVLKPYPGTATLIRAGEKSLRSSRDPHAAWFQLARELQIHEIPGDHYDMLVPPQVELLAETLKACIDRAVSERESATDLRIS
jgi:amino acid adenylation domain-containing protein